MEQEKDPEQLDGPRLTTQFSSHLDETAGNSWLVAAPASSLLDSTPLLHRLLPMLAWASSYRLAHLRGDFVAGLSVGIMVIPQGLAHAAIAGVSPVLGLYCAFLPLYVYALLGTSRAQSLGTGAIVALLVAGQISHLPPPAHDAAAVSLGFLVGLVHVTWDSSTWAPSQTS